MAEILCGYTADRDETIVAYLYGEIDPTQRSAFEAHLATCERCRHELTMMQDVRDQLQAWSVPEATPSVIHGVRNEPGAAIVPRRPSAWGLSRDIPAWAQVVAALVILGVSAGLANLDVRYDRNGLTILTGWSRTQATPATATGPDAERRASAISPTAVAPWRADLDALEGRLKAELTSSRAVAPLTADSLASSHAVDAETVRQIRALIRESERKQQNELALRIAEVMREFDTKRGSDLVNINQTLRTMQSNTGIEVLKQREALSRLDYLVRTSGQQR
jgi:Putative zinc-finger